MSTIWEILFSLFWHLKIIYLCAGFISRINGRREIQRIEEIQKEIENMDCTLFPAQTRYPLTWTHGPGVPPVSDLG
jgi:hypothetical protein